MNRVSIGASFASFSGDCIEAVRVLACEHNYCWLFLFIGGRRRAREEGERAAFALKKKEPRALSIRRSCDWWRLRHVGVFSSFGLFSFRRIFPGGSVELSFFLTSSPTLPLGRRRVALFSSHSWAMCVGRVFDLYSYGQSSLCKSARAVGNVAVSIPRVRSTRVPALAFRGVSTTPKNPEKLKLVSLVAAAVEANVGSALPLG
jgi:hypothetical protein